jgi:hypothetical protein
MCSSYMINDLAVELPWSKFRDGRRETCKRDAYRLGAVAAHSVNWYDMIYLLTAIG